SKPRPKSSVRKTRPKKGAGSNTQGVDPQGIDRTKTNQIRSPWITGGFASYFFGPAGAAAGGAPDGRATLRSAAWPPKVRVGANSPSLWPTMFSVTNTVMNLRPLWTLKFRPTNSGVTVERRDHVLMTRRSLALSAFSILSWRCPSTKAPFFAERMAYLLRRLMMNLSVVWLVRVFLPLLS